MASDPPAGGGLLPPDGSPWPPEPDLPDDAQAGAQDWSLPAPATRPTDAEVADWRAMPVDVPEGYAGSSSAPPLPAPRLDTFAVVAFVCAIVALVPFTWGVPVLPVLALAFGLVGRRNCQLDPTLQGRTLATVAVGLAVAAAVLEVVLVTTGHQTLGVAVSAATPGR